MHDSHGAEIEVGNHPLEPSAGESPAPRSPVIAETSRRPKPFARSPINNVWMGVSYGGSFKVEEYGS